MNIKNLAGYRVGMTGTQTFDQIDNDSLYTDLNFYLALYYHDPSDTFFSELATAKKYLEAMGT